jgi:biopolymer transport protein ExbB/TolQ
MIDQILFFTFCAVLLVGTVLSILSIALIWRGIYKLIDSLELLRHFEARDRALHHYYRSQQVVDPQGATAVSILESDFNEYRQWLDRGSMNTYDADVESVNTGSLTSLTRSSPTVPGNE